MPSQQPTSPTPSPSSPGKRGGSVRAAYRQLRMAGFTEGEAGNLSAHLAGLSHATNGWTLREVERLLFLRTLVESGRLQP